MTIALLLDALHSLRFCLRVLPFGDALRLPVLVSRSVRLGRLHRGAVVLSAPLRRGMVRIGYQGFSAIPDGKGLVDIAPGGRIVFDGAARLGQGVRLWVDEGAVLRLGDGFYCNKGCVIRAADDVTIGAAALWGWDVELNTADGHVIVADGREKASHAPIRLGRHVWVASHVVVGKGASVADDSVVAQRSTVTRAFSEPGVLLGGTPAEIIKHDITWRE